jgi:hypothetical protein
MSMSDGHGTLVDVVEQTSVGQLLREMWPRP